MKRLLLISVLLVFALTALCAMGDKAVNVSDDPEKPYKGVKLTWLTASNANVEGIYDDLADTPWAQYVMDKTGIEIEFICVDNKELGDRISQMKKLGSLPDIIEYKWGLYPGGAAAAIKDKVIINLSSRMDANAPNLMSLLRNNSEIAKAVRTTSGEYYCFPFLRGLTEPNVTQFSSCFILRDDILSSLGLERPETIDEWEDVLRAFKKYGFEEPFVTREEWMVDVWSPAYDNWGDFYVENGVVKNGLVERERYDVLSKLSSWYREGLIESDYYDSTKKTNEEDFTSGKAGSVYAPIGQGLGNYCTIMAQSGIKADDIRATIPVTSRKGRNAKFSKMNPIFGDSGYSAAISTKCRNVEAAMWLLDWMYSEEGNLLCNYGIEGVSYVMVEGKPVYTEIITDNPDMTMASALAVYTRASSSCTCVQDEDYILQYYSGENQREALELCLRTDMGKYFYPGATVANEDADTLSSIMNDISQYSETMEEMFITGRKELNETTWEQYVNELRDMGIEKALSMMQKAYDEYQRL